MPRRLALLDVGARGGLQWPWSQFGPEEVSVTLVEPDPEEAKRLQAVRAEEIAVLPIALWHTDGTVGLHLTRSAGTSSVYEPNRAFLTQFPEVERFDVLETVQVPAESIDALAASGRIPGFDFAKLDVQGAELAVLEGGVKHLSANLVGLELEVEFAPLYSGQPLFSNVDIFIRQELGLQLWDLRKAYWKYALGSNTRGPTKGRLVFGDALYFRPLSGIEEWLAGMSAQHASEKIAMLVLCVVAYGYYDYAATILNAPQLSQYFGPGSKALKDAVEAYGPGFYPWRHGNSYLHMMFDALALAFKPTHNGWATGERGLGSRRRGPFWL